MTGLHTWGVYQRDAKPRRWVLRSHHKTYVAAERFRLGHRPSWGLKIVRTSDWGRGVDIPSRYRRRLPHTYATHDYSGIEIRALGGLLGRAA